jgi:hypothetical protein
MCKDKLVPLPTAASAGTAFAAKRRSFRAEDSLLLLLRALDFAKIGCFWRFRRADAGS